MDYEKKAVEVADRIGDSWNQAQSVRDELAPMIAAALREAAAEAYEWCGDNIFHEDDFGLKYKAKAAALRQGAGKEG